MITGEKSIVEIYQDAYEYGKRVGWTAGFVLGTLIGAIGIEIIRIVFPHL